MQIIFLIVSLFFLPSYRKLYGAPKGDLGAESLSFMYRPEIPVDESKVLDQLPSSKSTSTMKIEARVNEPYVISMFFFKMEWN